MKRPGVLMILLSCLALLLRIDAHAGEKTADGIVFGLCQSNVAGIAMKREKGKITIDVKLTAGGTRELAALTERNVGALLTILAGDLVASRAIVRDRISSGVVRLGPYDEKDVTHLTEILIERLPESPCGAAQSKDPAERSTAARLTLV